MHFHLFHLIFHLIFHPMESFCYMAKRTRLPKEACVHLMDVLRKGGYRSPGTLARVLLEALVFDEGKLSSDTFYGQKAGAAGTYTKTRDALVKDEFISVIEPNGRLIPKQRLKPYVDEAKKQTHASVSFVVDYVDSKVKSVADDVQDLKAQIHQIYELLAELKRLQAPPPSAEAQARSGEIAEELQTLMLCAHWAGI
jgi:hypothetical protein